MTHPGCCGPVVLRAHLCAALSVSPDEPPDLAQEHSRRPAGLRAPDRPHRGRRSLRSQGDARRRTRLAEAALERHRARARHAAVNQPIEMIDRERQTGQGDQWVKRIRRETDRRRNPRLRFAPTSSRPTERGDGFPTVSASRWTWDLDRRVTSPATLPFWFRALVRRKELPANGREPISACARYRGLRLHRRFLHRRTASGRRRVRATVRNLGKADQVGASIAKLGVDASGASPSQDLDVKRRLRAGLAAIEWRRPTLKPNHCAGFERSARRLGALDGELPRLRRACRRRERSAAGGSGRPKPKRRPRAPAKAPTICSSKAPVPLASLSPKAPSTAAARSRAGTIP